MIKENPYPEQKEIRLTIESSKSLENIRGHRLLTFVQLSLKCPSPSPALLMAYQYFFSKYNFHPTVNSNPPSNLLQNSEKLTVS